MLRGATKRGDEFAPASQLHALITVIEHQQILPPQHLIDLARPREFKWVANSCWFHTFIQCMAAYNLNAYTFAPSRKRSISDFTDGMCYVQGQYSNLHNIFETQNMYDKITNVVGSFGAFSLATGKYHSVIDTFYKIESVKNCFWLDVEGHGLAKYIKKFVSLLHAVKEKRLVQSTDLTKMHGAADEAHLGNRISKLNEQIKYAYEKFQCRPRALYVFQEPNHFFAHVEWHSGHCFKCDDLHSVQKIESLFNGVDYLNITAILFVKP